MNGIHDMGGMANLGDIPLEPGQLGFQHDWERQVFGTNVWLQMVGHYYSIHELRYAMERIAPAEYLTSPYFVHWLDGIQRVLLEKGYLTEDELARGSSDAAAQATAVPPPSVLPASNAPLFGIGDRLRAKNLNPHTHIRLPRYVRGHVGTVVARPGAYPFADALAHVISTESQHVYTVRFEGSELWGPQAGVKDAVHVDLYETYVEAA